MPLSARRWFGLHCLVAVAVADPLRATNHTHGTKRGTLSVSAAAIGLARYERHRSAALDVPLTVRAPDSLWKDRRVADARPHGDSVRSTANTH